jgi:WD40 repeat protein
MIAVVTPSRLLLVLLLIVPRAVAGEPGVDTLGDPLPPGAVARLGTVRLRPGMDIESLLFSPDGKRLACWHRMYGPSSAITLWDAGTGRELRRLPRPDTMLYDWAWLPDGHGLAVMSRMDIVAKPIGQPFAFDFDAATIESRDFSGTANEAPALFIIAPAAYVLAVIDRGKKEGDGYTIEIRELAADKPLRDLKLVRTLHSTLPLAWHPRLSPDGRTLIELTRIKEGEFRAVIREVATGAERRRLTLPSPHPIAVSNEFLAVGERDGGLRLYELSTGNERHWPGLHAVPGPAGGVQVLAFSPDGTTLATAGNDHLIRLWNVSNGKLRRDFTIREIWPPVVAFSPDGKRLAAGGISGTIHLLDVVSGAALTPLPGHEGFVRSVSVTDDGRTAVTCGYDQTIRVWDLGAARERRRIDVSGRINECALTPDGQTVIARMDSPDARQDPPLHRWNIADGQEIQAPELLARSMKLAADGRTLATIRGDKAEVRDWPSGALRREIKLPPSPVPGLMTLGVIVAISPDGKLLVTATSFATLRPDGSTENSESGPMELWETATGTRLRELGSNDFRCALFTPTGELLIAGYQRFTGSPRDQRSEWNDVISVLSQRTGRVIREIALPRKDWRLTAAIALSPDARTVYVGGFDGSILAYEVASGGLRYRLTGHRDRVTGLAVQARSRRLVSASTDTTALMWAVSLPAAAAPNDFDAVWNDLADADAAKAYRALAAFAAAPERAARFIVERLPPAGAGPTDAALDRLVADLDSADFNRRESAETELDKLVDLAAEAIRQRLSGAKTAEARRRLTRVVEKIDAATPAPARLREIRALELLEHLATPDARDVLAKLAKGNPNALRTLDAAAALRRLQ